MTAATTAIQLLLLLLLLMNQLLQVLLLPMIQLLRDCCYYNISVAMSADITDDRVFTDAATTTDV